MSFLTVSASSTADILSAAGVLFTDLWSLIAVAIGIPLAFYVIRQVIGLFPKTRARRA